MFRNKILVRARPPFSPSASPFLLLPLRLDQPRPSSPVPVPVPVPVPDPSFFVKLEALCWKLSRAWRVACLCFPGSPDDDVVVVVVVYQRCQSESVGRVVKQLIEELPIGNVGPEEEVTSSSLVVKALECALRCAFLDGNWRCLGDNLFVYSDFSSDEERSYLYALQVRVQLEMDDGFIFLVSPDVVRFSRYKIADILISRMELNFYDGKEVTLENHNSAKPCYVLPSLYEGYVIGLGKVLPSGENLGHFEELWSFKHGLALPNDYFIKIQFRFGGHANQKWLPSAFVLQGSGLAPALQTTRTKMAVSALNSFLKTVEGWNFFGQGCLRVQVVSSFDIGSELFTWTKAANAINICVSRETSNFSTDENTKPEMTIPTGILSANDFRTPKPAGCTVSNRMLEHTALGTSNKIANKTLPSDKSVHAQDIQPFVSTAKLRPVFRERKASKKTTIYLGVEAALSTKIRNRVDKNCLLTGSPRKTTGTSNEERHLSVEAYVTDNRYCVIVAETDAVNPQRICKDSGKNAGKDKNVLQIRSEISQKEQSDISLGNSTLGSTEEEPLLEVSGKRTTNKREKSKDNTTETTKKKSKIQSDPSDIIAKAITYHRRGQLESLTVAELKRFLISKKAKVGGKKEDLIQRITALLD